MITKERYMIEELADRWNCTKDDILWEIKQNRLSAIIEENYRPSTNTLHVSNYVMSTEVERYEQEQQITPAIDPGKNRAEIQSMILKGRVAHKDDKEIAAEIDSKFPGITDAQMGGFFPNQEHESHDARRKRGQRLRGKAK